MSKNSPLRVVIVDDSYSFCGMLSGIINRFPGFEVVGSAYDGISALDIIEKTKPDIVLLDIEMPRMNG